MFKSEVNMLSGPVLPGLLRMTIPIMVMQILQALFNILDMTILKMAEPPVMNELGELVDSVAVGAVGACTQLISVFTVIVIGLATGANIVIARHIGSGDSRRVERAVGASTLLAIITAAIMVLIGVPFAEIFLKWTNCPKEFLTSSVTYLRIYFISMPFFVIYNFGAGTLRSKGDTGRPMIYLIIGGGVKVVFTYLFASVFKMGVVGVAFSTVVSWLIPAVLVLVVLFREKGILRFNYRHIKFYGREFYDILFVGIPSSAQSVSYSLANVFIVATVNTFGKEASTAVSISGTFENIIYQIAIASSLAIMPYVSQNIGNRNIKRARKSVWGGILISAVLICIFGWLTAALAAPLSSLMTDDPVVIALSRQKMLIVSLPYALYGISEVLGAAMRGFGRPIVTAVTSLVHICALRFFWIFVIFPLNRELWFLFIVWPIGWILTDLTLLVFYFPTVKKLKARFEKEKKREEVPLT